MELEPGEAPPYVIIAGARYKSAMHFWHAAMTAAGVPCTDDQYDCVLKAIEYLGLDIEPELVRKRLRRGWSHDEALGVAAPPPVTNVIVSVDGQERLFQSVLHAGRELSPSVKHSTIYGRLSRGWSIEAALELEERVRTPSVVLNISGQTFAYPSLDAARQAHASHLTISTVRARIHTMHWSLEEALDLTERVPRCTKVEVAGKEYPSLAAAAATLAPDLSPGTVWRRWKSDGWSIEEALGLVDRPKVSITVDQRQFDSFEAARRALCPNLKSNTMQSRLARGWTLEQVFEIEERPKTNSKAKSVEVKGVRYSSLAAACSSLAPHLKTATVIARYRKLGWTIEQALELKPRAKSPVVRGRPITARGIDFPSIPAAIRHFDLSLQPGAVAVRLNKGLTPEQALGLEETPDQWQREQGMGRPVTVNGVRYPSLTKAHAAVNSPVPITTVWYRIYAGIAPEAALLTPRKKTGPKAVTVFGKPYPSLRKAYDEIRPKVTFKSIKGRLSRGKHSIDEAFLGIKKPFPTRERKSSEAVQ
ncbi:hypothetical protein A3709_19055 [Halioglobus sp. HI00S01]|nr:hypothetical protein A3709_19055 [Halioglobus sp. HI00S01]